MKILKKFQFCVQFVLFCEISTECVTLSFTSGWNLLLGEKGKLQGGINHFGIYEVLQISVLAKKHLSFLPQDLSSVCCNERGVNWAVSVSRKAGGISEVK